MSQIKEQEATLIAQIEAGQAYVIDVAKRRYPAVSDSEAMERLGRNFGHWMDLASAFLAGARWQEQREQENRK